MITISHRYNTRSANKEPYIRRTNTTYGKFDIKYSAAKVWNDIPLGTRNSSSLAIFKKQFKNTSYHRNCYYIRNVYSDILYWIKLIIMYTYSFLFSLHLS